jgi:diguanylate cyclase (GGDEF)-like protein
MPEHAKKPPHALPSEGYSRRKVRATALASLGLVLILGALATGIAVSWQQSRARLVTNFGLRGAVSADFVSTFLTQEAGRGKATAEEDLAGARVPAAQFVLVASAFGSHHAVLLDSAGKVLAAAPTDKSSLGKSIAQAYPSLAAAEQGRVSVSDVVRGAGLPEAVASIAVPFATRAGRRVFSFAYGVSGSALGAFVDHTISYPEHEVFLLDSSGQLIAASPRTSAVTLRGVDPLLARAISGASRGAVKGARTPSTFTVARVPGTSWRIVIAVPDSRLFASIAGWSQITPWLIFALVSMLGLMLVALYSRSLADRTRLAGLSLALEKSARTDPLTNLYNRRALAEYLTLLTAHARRRGEPMSVLMIDLDFFKQVNDQFGHAAGDTALRAIADCMRGVLRADDVCGRWGGDEFLVLIPTGDENDARVVAERLQAAAGALDLSDIGVPQGVALSIGRATAVHATPEEIVATADLALYESKRNVVDLATLTVQTAR